jgi:hypothetical protein
MVRTALMIVAFFGLSFAASAQGSAPQRFPIRIVGIKRVNEGCTVEAKSATVRFALRSLKSAPCAMLNAGETYQAVKATAATDAADEIKDVSILIVYNNVRNPRRENAVFDIDSEETVEQK